MANIEIGQLLTDPDLCSQIQVVSRTAQVNSLGENIPYESYINTVGSIQPASFKEIQRLPEAMRVVNMYSFWIKGDVIVATNPNQYSSILIMNGVRFQVMTVESWVGWGAGFSKGVCVAQVPS